MAGSITDLAMPKAFDAIGGSMGGAAGEVMGGAGIASMAASALVPGAGWVQLGLSVLGAMMKGDVDQSQAGAGSDGHLNTSGWVVGKGDANGGELSSSKGAAWPWYVWAALTVGAVVFIRKAA